MSNQSKYPLEIYWSETDQCYIASAPDLKGCFAHGASREEALSEIQLAIRLWLETAVEDGGRIPVPSKNLVVS